MECIPNFHLNLMNCWMAQTKYLLMPFESFEMQVQIQYLFISDNAKENNNETRNL